MANNILTPKQKIFADEYLVDFNATRAYKVAYPNTKNDQVAASSAAKLLRLPKVKKYIETRTNEFEKQAIVTKEQVLQEFVNIAFVDITEFISVCGNSVVVKDIEHIPKELRRAIASIKETRFGVEVKFYNKVDALNSIGQHLGMFKNKVDVSVTTEDKVDELFNKLESEIDGSS